MNLGINAFTTQVLVFLYQITGNLGWAIIIFTVVLRVLLYPLSIKSMRAQKEIKKLQPEVNKLKQKHKDSKKLQAAQMELYKKYNVNPLSGCLPQIIQLVLLIVLYQVFINFLGQEVINGVTINHQFLWFNLHLPDKTYLLPIIVALSQLLFSLMILPGGETLDLVPNKNSQKNEKEENVAEMAQTMQKQMLFMMPVMTGFFAARFPSGLALYWLISTLMSMVQQGMVSGLGGLEIYTKRALALLKIPNVQNSKRTKKTKN